MNDAARIKRFMSDFQRLRRTPCLGGKMWYPFRYDWHFHSDGVSYLFLVRSLGDAVPILAECVCVA